MPCLNGVSTPFFSWAGNLEMIDGYWPTAADQPGASKHDIEHSAWYNKVSKVVLSETLRGQ